MRAHLNALDTVDEGIRQLDKLERTRDAYQMQQESLSITQLIQVTSLSDSFNLLVYDVFCHSPRDALTQKN